MIKIKRQPVKKIKWGVAGLGRFAETVFIPAVALLRKSSVEAVFSHDEERAKSVASMLSIPASYSDYDEFLKSDINAVYIASANAYHYEQVIKAAKAGKHILCEKPLAMNSAQAEEMVKVCKENNVQLAVDYLLRFNKHIVKAKEFIENGHLGTIVNIIMNLNIDLPPGANYRHNIELSGGGALRDSGTHLIDLMRYLGGEIEMICGAIDNVVYKSSVDDFSSGIIKFKESGYGYFSVSYNSKKAFNRVEVTGHLGAISIESLFGSRNYSSKLTIMFEGETKKAFRKRSNKILLLLKSAQESFLKNETPAVTGEDGLINLQLMEALEANAINR